MRCAVVTLALLALCCLALPGCGEEQRTKLKDAGRTIGETAGRTWADVKSFTLEKKDQAVELFGTSKDKLGEQFAKAKEKSADWGADAKQGLETKWQAVQETYAWAKDATGETWEAARDAFVAASEAFKRALAEREAK